MGVRDSIKRVDAYDKVTGAAKYTADLLPAGALVAKVVRSTIANGKVVSFDLTQALQVKGVVRIFTCFDVPDIEFATAGHPYSLDKAKGDVYDRKLLNQRVRVYGDDIAAVVAVDEVAAARAARLVKVTYEEYPPILSVDAALAPEATPLHPNVRETNLLAHSSYAVGTGTYEEAKASEPGLVEFEGEYATQTVQHCHLEPVQSFAYMEANRIVVVSSTQIPHIARRVVGQALGKVFYQSIAEMQREGQRLAGFVFRNLQRAMKIAFIPMLLFAAFGDAAITMFFGGEYGVGGVLCRIIVFRSFMTFVSTATQGLDIVLHKQRAIMLACIYQTVLACASVALAYYLGGDITLCALLMSVTFIAVEIGYFCRMFTVMQYPAGRYARSILLSLGGILLLSLLLRQLFLLLLTVVPWGFLHWLGGFMVKTSLL